MRTKGKRTKLSKSYSIDKKLSEEFEAHCKENCTNASMLVERLIKTHMEENGKKR